MVPWDEEWGKDVCSHHLSNTLLGSLGGVRQEKQAKSYRLEGRMSTSVCWRECMERGLRKSQRDKKSYWIGELVKFARFSFLNIKETIFHLNFFFLHFLLILSVSVFMPWHVGGSHRTSCWDSVLSFLCAGPSNWTHTGRLGSRYLSLPTEPSPQGCRISYYQQATGKWQVSICQDSWVLPV